MDFLGLMRVKFGGEFIEEVLEAQHFCEKIIVLNNYSADNTKEICAKFKNVQVIDTPFPDTYGEGRDKEFLCDLALQENPKWICHVQEDEVLERDTYEKLKPYINDRDVRCIEVHSLNYWNDDKTLRVDGAVGKGFRQTFWKYPGRKLTWDPMHCSLPRELCGIPMIQPGIALWHYGFMNAERRLRTNTIMRRADSEPRDYRWPLQGDPGGEDKSVNLTGEPFRLQSVDDFLVGKPYSRRAREYNES